MKRLSLYFVALTMLALIQPTQAMVPEEPQIGAASQPTTTESSNATVSPQTRRKSRALDDGDVAEVSNPSGEVLAKGGGRRGDGDPDLFLAAVAPVDVARTRFEQPLLFFHLSKPTKLRVIVAVSREGAAEQEGVIEFPEGLGAGFHQVDLEAMKINLVPELVYEWVVAIVEDDKYRSKDLVVTGFIQRILVDDLLQQRIESTKTLDSRAEVLQGAGLTQDTLSMLVAVDRKLTDKPEHPRYHQRLLQALQLTETSAGQIRVKN